MTPTNRVQRQHTGWEKILLANHVSVMVKYFNNIKGS